MICRAEVIALRQFLWALSQMDAVEVCPEDAMSEDVPDVSAVYLENPFARNDSV